MSPSFERRQHLLFYLGRKSHTCREILGLAGQTHSKSSATQQTRASLHRIHTTFSHPHTSLEKVVHLPGASTYKNISASRIQANQQEYDSAIQWNLKIGMKPHRDEALDESGGARAVDTKRQRKIREARVVDMKLQKKLEQTRAVDVKTYWHSIPQRHPQRSTAPNTNVSSDNAQRAALLSVAHTRTHYTARTICVTSVVVSGHVVGCM